MLLERIGLHPEIVADRDSWIDVLIYGYPEGSWWIKFDIESLGEDELAALRELAELYFEAGFDYVEPLALGELECQRLRDRFDPSGSYLQKWHRDKS